MMAPWGGHGAGKAVTNRHLHHHGNPGPVARILEHSSSHAQGHHLPRAQTAVPAGVVQQVIHRLRDAVGPM